MLVYWRYPVARYEEDIRRYWSTACLRLRATTMVDWRAGPTNCNAKPQRRFIGGLRLRITMVTYWRSWSINCSTPQQRSVGDPIRDAVLRWSIGDPRLRAMMRMYDDSGLSHVVDCALQRWSFGERDLQATTLVCRMSSIAGSYGGRLERCIACLRLCIEERWFIGDLRLRAKMRLVYCRSSSARYDDT